MNGVGHNIALFVQDMRMTVNPSLGGTVHSFQLKTPAGLFDIFRPYRGLPGAMADALRSSMFPFVNCIRDNQFTFDGRKYKVAPNMKGVRLNFHGSGWQQPWTVTNSKGGTLAISLENGTVGSAFHFSATQKFQLHAGGLNVRIGVENRSDRTMPFSLGLHPWFPKHSGVEIRFFSKKIWQADREGQTTKELPISPDCDYGKFRPPPDQYWNTCYSGWDGIAEIYWAQEDIRLEVIADPIFMHLMAHVPANDPTTFCLEPQTNAPCGFDMLEIGSFTKGVHFLKPGQSVCGTIKFLVTKKPTVTGFRKMENEN
jgi:aldose 1-epimerase